MSAVDDPFLVTVTRTAALVRLGTLAVALLGLTGGLLTVPMAVAFVALSALGAAQVFSVGMVRLLLEHPIVLVGDVLLVLTVLAMVGTDSPLVLATFPTALLVGLLFRARVAVAMSVILVAGYLLAYLHGASGTDERGFMVLLGVPTIYVAFVVVGLVVRRGHLDLLRVQRDLARAEQRTTAADERARLAREMHDSLGKTLQGLSLAAQALPGWIERDAERAGDQARAIATGADTAVRQARGLLVRMRQDVPDEDFGAVVRRVCAQWAASAQIGCEVDCDDDVDPALDERYEMVAVLTEALENVRRHAEATSVAVRVARDEAGVRLSVHDDGRGFDPNQTPTGRFGVLGMQERARGVGATLAVTSSPGAGTTVEFAGRGA